MTTPSDILDTLADLADTRLGVEWTVTTHAPDTAGKYTAWLEPEAVTYATDLRSASMTMRCTATFQVPRSPAAEAAKTLRELMGTHDNTQPAVQPSAFWALGGHEDHITAAGKPIGTLEIVGSRIAGADELADNTYPTLVVAFVATFAA